AAAPPEFDFPNDHTRALEVSMARNLKALSGGQLTLTEAARRSRLEQLVAQRDLICKRLDSSEVADREIKAFSVELRALAAEIEELQPTPPALSVVADTPDEPWPT